MNSYYDEYLNIFVDTFSAVLVMAHPLISCIVYGTQNDNYHNQLRGKWVRDYQSGDTTSCDLYYYHQTHHALLQARTVVRRKAKSIDLKRDWQDDDTEKDNDRKLAIVVEEWVSKGNVIIMHDDVNDSFN